VQGEERTTSVSGDVSEGKAELDTEAKKSGKRRHSPEEDAPVKRKRGHRSNADSESVTTHERKSSPLANSDGISLRDSHAPSTKKSSMPSGGTQDDDITLAVMPTDSVNDLLGDDDESEDPLFDEPKSADQSTMRRSVSVSTGSTSLPSHRARAANPLIKMADEPNFGLGMDSAIAAKARLMGHASTASNGETSSNGGPSRSLPPRPGPGRSSQGLQAKNRSSLLVFQKGTLQTRKGKYRPSEGTSGNAGENGWGDDMELDGISAVDASPDKPLTGQELLVMAGLDIIDAEALPDFEDDAPQEAAPAAKEASVQSRYVLYSELLHCNLTDVVLQKASHKRSETCSQHGHRPRSSVPSTLLGNGLRFSILCTYLSSRGHLRCVLISVYSVRVVSVQVQHWPLRKPLQRRYPHAQHSP